MHTPTQIWVVFIE